MLRFDKVGVDNGGAPEAIYIDPVTGTTVEETGPNTTRVTINGVSHAIVGKCRNVKASPQIRRNS